MKYCFKCGTQITDESVFCSSCGERQIVQPQQDKKSNTAIVTANKVLLIISCAGLAIVLLFGIIFAILSAVVDPEAQLGAIVMGIYLIILSLPLAWMLPMTIRYFKKVKAGESMTVAFKICVLLFVNMLVGIFMLCFEPNADDKQTTQ